VYSTGCVNQDMDPSHFVTTNNFYDPMDAMMMSAVHFFAQI